jgi:hypothetical protein
MKQKTNGVRADTTQENITITLDKMSSGFVRWYAQLEHREIVDAVNGIISERLEHLREGEESGFTDDTSQHIREGVMDAIDRRLLAEARGFTATVASTRHGDGSSQTEKAIEHLKGAIAKRFGCGFDTDCGAGTLYISHDGVSLTDARSHIVAHEVGSIARQLSEMLRVA